MCATFPVPFPVAVPVLVSSQLFPPVTVAALTPVLPGPAPARDLEGGNLLVLPGW